MAISREEKRRIIELVHIRRLGKKICDELNARYEAMPVGERLQHNITKMEDEVVKKYADPIPCSEYPDSIAKREPDMTQTIHVIKWGSKLLRIYYDGEVKEYCFDWQ
ncbi:hypothetical protein Mjas_01425 [Methanothermococcus sp. Ax23]|uniref:hypothetical protein n=1 Tax=Methanothermococcus sp. Ax23 TaxID=3156486 RepID=UPI003BA062E8